MTICRWFNKLLTALIVCVSLTVSAQENTDEQLAAYYYREGEFAKASLYYERLYNKSQSDENYEYLLTCFSALKEYKEAERLARHHAKQHPNKPSFQVDVGHVLKLSGQENKAEKHFAKLVRSSSTASVSQILNLGEAFTEIGEEELALEVYYSARRHLGNSYPFHFQIAKVLGQQGDIEGMIGEYLDVLKVSKGYTQNVQNTLNRVVGFEEDNRYNSILQEQLTKRIQRNPGSEVYGEMLIWMFMKQNRFDAAMAEVKAMDKRNKEDGTRVMNLAKTAQNNYKFDVAIDGYEYVKQKGPDGYHYIASVIGLLKAHYAQVTSSQVSEESIAALSNEYRSTLEEFGQTANTWEMIRDYAHVKAFYESKYRPEASREAGLMLQDAIELPGLKPEQLAALKLELADIYVLENQIWDASLLYGQVETQFKYDEIGFEAKLKNGKVFYYSGDFGWAEAKLDALKGSTSKLIANDALELSVFISENTGLDTTTDALALFARSELMALQHKYDSAEFYLDLISSNYPTHDLQDNIYYQKAILAQEQGNPEEAVKYYEMVFDTYSEDILADNALMAAGRILELELNDKEKAMSLYERIIQDHTGSLYIVEARKRYRNLRGDQLN